MTGEVEHLVGEAPLVWNRLRRFPGTTDLCCHSVTTVSPFSLFFDQNFKLHVFVSLSYQLRQLFTFRAYHIISKSARKMCKTRTFSDIYTNYVQTLVQPCNVGGFPCSYFLNYTNCKQDASDFVSTLKREASNSESTSINFQITPPQRRFTRCGVLLRLMYC